MRMRPSLSAYRMRAWLPTTSLFSCALRIQCRLSAICWPISAGASFSMTSSTSPAMRSLVARSFGSPLVHTHRNGPKPWSKQSGPMMSST